MKHASTATLSALEPLLRELRRRPLVERAPGAFYLRAKAFAHFHEDASGLYADVKLDGASFSRLRVVSRHERQHLLRLVDRALEQHQ